MIQFAYQPAFDPFHTIFRFLRITNGVTPGPIPYDKLRILDFYLLFPFRIETLRLRQGDSRYRALANKYKETRGYAEQPGAVTVFDRMAFVQEAASQTLCEYGAFDGDLLSMKGEVAFAPDYEITPDLKSRIADENGKQYDLIAFLRHINEYPLLGRDGLKDRSGLMEHRYDAA